MILLVNKLKIHRFLAKSNKLVSFLPETKALTKASFEILLSKYREVFIKPTFGGQGIGIIKVSAQGNEVFIIHYENKRWKVEGTNKAYLSIKALTKSRSYIVQQGIPLAEIYRRPTDMRVIVQRKTIKDPWEVTARVIKIAGRGFIVTNITKSNGKLITVDKGIKKMMPHNDNQQAFLTNIDQLSQKVAKKLNTLYPKHRIYGLDIAIDKNARLWLIEANRTPAMSHFTKLKDKTMLRRIVRYKRGN